MQIPAKTEPEKDKTLLNILLVGCGFLFLIAAGLVFLFARTFVFTKAPASVVKAHLEAINRENYALAYSHFALDYRKETSLEDFRRQIAPFSNMLPYRSADLNRTQIVNNRSSVDGLLTGRDGSLFPVRYQLVRDQGTWKIVSFEWISPGDKQVI